MNLYTYRISEVNRVIDGDTLDVSIDVGFGITVFQRIRMEKYDAPETWRPVTEAELKAGEKCTQYLKNLISEHIDNLFIITSKHIGIYGRYGGELFYKDGVLYKSINDLMVKYIDKNKYYKKLLRAKN